MGGFDDDDDDVDSDAEMAIESSKMVDAFIVRMMMMIMMERRF